jgi:hypothetical protein
MLKNDEKTSKMHIFKRNKLQKSHFISIQRVIKFNAVFVEKNGERVLSVKTNVTNARFCLIGIAGNSSFFQLVFKHSGNS